MRQIKNSRDTSLLISWIIVFKAQFQILLIFQAQLSEHFLLRYHISGELPISVISLQYPFVFSKFTVY